MRSGRRLCFKRQTMVSHSSPPAAHIEVNGRRALQSAVQLGLPGEETLLVDMLTFPSLSSQEAAVPAPEFIPLASHAPSPVNRPENGSSAPREAPVTGKGPLGSAPAQSLQGACVSILARGHSYRAEPHHRRHERSCQNTIKYRWSRWRP